MNCGNCEVPRCVLLFSVLPEIIIVKCKVNLDFYFFVQICACVKNVPSERWCRAAKLLRIIAEDFNLNVMFIFLLFIITY